MEFEISYLGVAVATIVAYAIGAIWYSVLFKKAWMREMGYAPGMMPVGKLSPRTSMIIGFFTTLLITFVFAHFASVMAINLHYALSLAFWTWLGYFVPLSMGAVLWDNKSWKLFAINAAHYLVALLAIAVVLQYV